MAINSNKKGKTGELELSKKLKEYGFQTRRSQQYCGKGGESADVVGLDGIHIECKRVEKLNIDLAYQQAVEDSKEGTIPAVFHRRNRKEWKVTLSLEDFIKMYKSYSENKR